MTFEAARMTSGNRGRLIPVVAAALFLLSASAVAAQAKPDPSAPALADQSFRLDQLFADLTTADAVQGREIEQQIWALWLQSGDDEVDRLMVATLGAMNTQAFGPALAFLNRIVAMKPDFAEGWNKRATLYYLVNEYDKSIADIQTTLALEPRHFGALSGLGMIMMRIGDERRAIVAFRKALEVNPTMEGVRNTVSELEKKISEDL
jgi:tetratricopeptide (TPR) repeat protein